MRTTVSIPGIHCEGCSRLIQDVSSDFPEIQTVDVDINAKTVTLDHSDDFDFDAWKREIESLDGRYRVQQS